MGDYDSDIVLVDGYDAFGQKIVERQVNNQGESLRNETQYDRNGRVVAVIQDADGVARTTRYEYDGQDNRIVQIEGAGTEFSIRTEYQYDALNNLLQQTQQAEGQSRNTELAYDEHGRLSYQREHDGYGTRYAHHPEGQVRTNHDRTGGLTD